MSTIRLVVDANEANVPHRVGSNTYAFRLLLELEKQTRPGSRTVGGVSYEDQVPMDWTILLSAPPVADMPKERAGWQYVVVKPAFMWTQWRLPLYLFAHRKVFDGIVSLGHYAPRFSPIPSVICILDLAFLEFPQFFKKRDVYKLAAWTKYSAIQAKHIVTISDRSAKDIMATYHIAPEHISVIYPAVELPEDTDHENAKEEDELLAKYGVSDEGYIVSIGTIQPRKNMINLMKAFEKLEGRSEKLVFVGKPGWLTEEFDSALAASPAKDRIIVTGFVDEKTKYTLLKHAKCSVLVGFYEGFGIPVVESLGFGILPVVAKTGSLPEVAGEFGVFVDPYSPDDIARGLQQALDAQVTPMRRSQMREWASRFDWGKSGELMIETLREQFGRPE